MKTEKKSMGGIYCIYAGCSNSFCKCRDETKFFRLPKDVERCRYWLLTCGRDDLLGENLSQFYNKYRICSKHCEHYMFTNIQERTRLLDNAVPIRLEVSGESGGLRHHPSKKVSILENLVIKPVDTSPPLTSPVEIQTPKSFSSNSPRKQQLRQKLVVLKEENKKLKGEVNAALQTASEPTQDLFLELCDKFLTKDMAKLVKSQVLLLTTEKQGRRYAPEFKKFAMTLFFLSPRCYRQLQNTLLLPPERSLRRFIQDIEFSAGFKQIVFDMLKNKCHQMNAQDKICTICID
nr:unnamed protein product [Callosobruchus analis]